METERLIAALGGAGFDTSAQEVAEAIWLAGIWSTWSGPPAGTTEDQPVPSPAPPLNELDDPRSVQDQVSFPTPPSSDPDHPADQSIHLPADHPGSPMALGGAVLRIPEASAIAPAVALQRALRPLKRRIPASRRMVVDEAASAHLIAETGTWSLVLRRAPERWFDVAIVVDTAPSMSIWETAARDLHRALRQFGGFRDVRRWDLIAGVNGLPCIGAHNAFAGSTTRRPSELLDPTGRRIFLMITDAAAPVWRTAAMTETLARWAGNGPLLIVQPLPERMWHRSALPTRRGTFRSLVPGAPTTRFQFTERRRKPRSLAARQVAVPVVEMSPDWFASWAALVMARRAGGVPLAAAFAPSFEDSDAEHEVPADIDAARLVERFRATTSPTAYLLATYLSATPVDLSVMRLVQRTFLPQSGPSQLAEVLLSGLLKKLRHAELDAEERFDFVPGVRALLLDDLRMSERRDVLRAVGRHIQQHVSLQDRTFAGAAAVSGAEPVDMMTEAFAWLPDEVIARLNPLTEPLRTEQQRPGESSNRQPAVTRKALLIGGAVGELTGVENDIAMMADALHQHGFAIDIRTAADATRAGILEAYEQMIDTTAPDDAIFVYYSGHSGHARPAAPDRVGLPDLYYIMPTDFHESTDGDFRGIASVELSLLWARLTEKTKNVTVALDSNYFPLSTYPRLTARPPQASTHSRPTYDSVAEHVTRLHQHGLPLDKLKMAGNPNVVRLLACGPQQQSYEYSNSDGVRIGMFTEALVLALSQAGDLRVTWATVMDWVRRRVLLLMPRQRPAIEGPLRRIIFDVAEADPVSTLPAISVGAGRVRLDGGPLLGVHIGDEFLVMPAGAPGPDRATKVGDARVVELTPVAALAELRLHPPYRAVPVGARAYWTRAVARAIPVKVPHPDPYTAELVDAISTSALVRMAGAFEPSQLHVLVDPNGRLTIHDQIGQISKAWGPNGSVQQFLTSLERLARATALRDLAADHAWALDEPITIDWGRVVGGQPSPLPNFGALVHIGQRIYVRLRNDSAKTLYASLIDIGVASSVAVLNTYDPSGIRLDPGAEHTFGYNQLEGKLVGSRVSWPADLDPAQGRQETIIVLVTSQPQHSSLLAEVRGDARRLAGSPLDQIMAQIATGSTRDVGNAADPASHFDVQTINFTLSPDPQPGLEIAEFQIDERPELSERLLARPVSPVQVSVAVRLSDFVVHHNRAMRAANIRIDTVVITGGRTSDEPSYYAYTERISNIRDGERLPLDRPLLYHGPAIDYLDLAIWVSRDNNESRPLADLLTPAYLRNAKQQLAIAGAEPPTHTALSAIDASAIVINAAYILLSGQVGSVVGLYRTTLLAHENFGIGRHFGNEELRAQDFSFSYTIEAVD